MFALIAFLHWNAYLQSRSHGRSSVLLFVFHLDLIETAACSPTRSCPRSTFAGRRLAERLSRTLMKSDEMFKTPFPATVSCKTHAPFVVSGQPDEPAFSYQSPTNQKSDAFPPPLQP